MFDVEYDTDPPSRTRATKRIIRYTISALKQQNIPQVDIFQEER
jgi:hypothetical protein